MIEYDVHDKIETPENVELTRTIAGLGSRISAGLFDYLLIVLIFLVIFFILALSSNVFSYRGGSMSDFVLAAFFIGMFLFYWGYFAFFEWITNGQTPGKKSVHLRVVCENGSPITFKHIAVRNIIRFVDMLPGMYFLAIVFIFCSKRKQRIGDMAAGTIVVSEEKLQYGATDKVNKKNDNWQMEITAEVLEKSGLSPEELNIIQNFYVRRSELSHDAIVKILPGILKPIMSRQGTWRDDMSISEMLDYIECTLQI